MKRFKKRLAQLTPEEAETVNRCHRQYVKTIPGKLDHASLVAVNLGKLSCNMAHSADPRLAVFPRIVHGIFGEGFQISTNQKRENSAFSLLIGFGAF